MDIKFYNQIIIIIKSRKSLLFLCEKWILGAVASKNSRSLLRVMAFSRVGGR